MGKRYYKGKRMEQKDANVLKIGREFQEKLVKEDLFLMYHLSLA